ncbi:hypothetical protein [Prescottella agglutinans]|uniref:Uncharacterized protein n=1 Tax=Prescottella agglutinans TaxID=1644129 RepID=A0ABT6MEW4_9NOCA|nr:hypothetical protein [Prescottella agglutinans]MDH6282855.1 hypothetical protein [Prescottella agglutinans]
MSAKFWLVCDCGDMESVYLDDMNTPCDFPLDGEHIDMTCNICEQGARS